MGESESRKVFQAIEIRGKRLPPGAIHCTGNLHVAVARVRWPSKTAQHWAVAAGVKERMAKYWLAGSYPVSDSGKLAIIRELQ